MKYTTFVLSLAAMLALATVTACKSADPAGGSTPANATSTQPAAASERASATQADDKALQEYRLNPTNTDKFNPSYVNRPDAFNEFEFQFDGKPMHAATVSAVIEDENQELCVNTCGSTIHFEDPNIPPAHVPQSINLELMNLGDLNGDGTDEIGVVADWWTSYWLNFHVLSYKNGNWYEMFIPPISINIAIFAEQPYIPVERIPDKPGFVRVRELDDETMELNEHVAEIPSFLQ